MAAARGRRGGAPRGFRPRRSRGQNLLVDAGVVEQILAAARVEPDSAVLEIGAGTGVLTRALAARAERVVAVEIDAELAIALRRRLRGYRNVAVLRRDARALDLEQIFPDRPYQVVANLPYSVGTPLLVDLLHSRNRPRRLTVMLQREVAERDLRRARRLVGADGDDPPRSGTPGSSSRCRRRRSGRGPRSPRP